MKPVVIRMFVVWMTWFLLHTAGYSHAYMDEGDVPEPDPNYGQPIPSSKNRKRVLQRIIRKQIQETRQLQEARQPTPTTSEEMILKGEQMVIDGEALKKKGELLMRHGREWIEKGNKKSENAKWMQQQIDKAKRGPGK